MEDALLNLLSNAGFPAVITGFFLWAAYKMAMPISQAHLALVDELRKSASRQSEILAQLERSVSIIASASGENHSEIVSLIKQIRCERQQGSHQL